MEQTNLTACFIGTRLEALEALGRYMKIKAILTVPDSWVYRDYKERDIPLVSTTRKNLPKTYEFLSSQPVDLVFSAGFPFILPNEVLESGSLFVNSHPSLLPAYKGIDAIKDAYRAQEEYLGVTVHHMVEEVDSGSTICQERVWVRGMDLQMIYDLLFGVVEPMAITRAIELLIKNVLSPSENAS